MVPRGAFVVVLSPAKALNEATLTKRQRAIIAEVTQPRFAARAKAMAEEARRELTAGKIKSLMGVSDAIATLNVGRFEAFEGAETKPCALAFDGPAFKHLNADGLETEEETTYLQTHLRVLSRNVRRAATVRRHRAVPDGDGDTLGAGRSERFVRILGNGHRELHRG